MKKNKALTAAFSVFALTMVSMCAIGGTFAKYTTNDNATDTAKVAKWGVTVEVNADETLTVTETDTDLAETDVVEGTTLQNVIAPGTKADLIEVSISGTPEVAVAVTYTADLVLTGWVIDTNVEYCPLVFTVGTTPFKIDGTTIKTVSELETAVEGAITARNRSISLENIDQLAESFKVSWSWAYSTSTDDDVKDTKLANLTTAPTVSLTVSATVTQVD